MGIDAARRHLSRWNREKDILEFATSSATVTLAAEAAGVAPAQDKPVSAIRMVTDTGTEEWEGA